MSRDEIRLMSFTPGKFWISLQAEVSLTSTVEIGNWKQASDPWISPLSANTTVSPKPRKRPSGGEKIRFPFISELSSSPQQCFDMVEWLPMSHFPPASPSNFPPPYVRCRACGGKTQTTLQWSNLTVQSSSNCASNFLEVLSTTWQQQKSEKLNKLLKQSQKRKLSYCCLFFFLPQWKHMYREQTCWLVSQWLTCNLLVKPLAMDAQGSILVHSFLFLSHQLYL